MENYLSEKHKSDLYASGLNDEIIEEAGFFTCSSDEANKFLDRNDINCECLVIPYLNSRDEFFRFKPDGIILGRDGKPAKYLQRSGTEPHLYAHPLIHKAIFNSEDDTPTLIVEGEKKALKATQELWFKEPTFKPICFGGVWNWRTHNKRTNKEGDVESVPDVVTDFKNLPINNRVFYICFDSDIEVNEQVQHAEEELSTTLIGYGATRVISIRIPYDGTTKEGIDDYLVKYGVDEFKKLVEQSSSSIAIRATIKLIRKIPHKTHIEKLDDISIRIINDLKLNGKFFNDSGGAYFFSNKSRRILNVEEEKFQIQLANEYGLFRGTSEFKPLLHKVQEHSVYRGEKTSILNFAYFSRDSNKTIIYNNDGGTYEIESNSSILFRTNGSNSFYFRHREYEKINYTPNKKNYFKTYLLDVLNFQQNENTLLTHEQQIFLFQVWFYSLFYPNLLPTKPILVMTGDYGSGKSTSQLLVGKLLFGNSFNLSTIQGEKDFLTSVINKYYLAYDNVDINTEWIRNAIASLSTGFKVEVRKLYTNMEMFQADPIAYLAMNSMSQSLYKRPDIASRLLIFRTSKIEGNEIPLGTLIGNVLKYRNEILSEVFDTIATINKYIDDRFVYPGKFRMADFANLGYKIAVAFGREKEFETILNIMSFEQATLPLEDNPLVDILDRWLNSRMTVAFISTGDLYAELSKIAYDNKMPFPWKSSQGLGQALNISLANLKNVFYIERQRGHANRMMWDIRYK